MPCRIVEPSCVCFVVVMLVAALELSNCEDYGCCPSVLLLLILRDVLKLEE